MADKNIQIKDKGGNKLFPAINLSLSNHTGTLPLAKGGTGGTSATTARSNLDVYSRAEVDNKIAAVDQFRYAVVDSLPAASANTEFIIYLIAETGVIDGSYVEYLTVKKSDGTYVWEKIGTTAADLTAYSKNTHTHTFTGTRGDISVSGSYLKTTGASASYTPAGSISLTRSTDVALNTTTVTGLSAVGTLPSLSTSTISATGDITYISDVTVKDGKTITYTAPTFTTTDIYSITGVGSLPTLTADTTASAGTAFITSLSKGSYTPSGTVTATFTGSASSGSTSIKPAGTVTLNNGTAPSFTISTATSTGAYQYVSGISSIRASASGSNTFVKTISGGSGSLTADTTSTNGVKYTEDISFTAPVLATATAYQITGVGSAASLTCDSTAAGGTAYISGLSNGSYTPTGNVNGAVSGKTLNISFGGTATSALVTGGTISYMHFNGGSVPTRSQITYATGAFSTAAALSKTTKYLHHNHTGASVATTGSALTGVTGGTTTATISYMKFTAGTTPKASATFTGSASSASVSITPTGTIAATFNGTATTSLVTSGTTNYLHFTQGSLPTRNSTAIKAYTGISSGGSAALGGSVTLNKTTNYLRFSAGSLPSKETAQTVITGVKTQPSFTATFSGTAATITSTITTSSNSITSTGKFTPAGVISQAK